MISKSSTSARSVIARQQKITEEKCLQAIVRSSVLWETGYTVKELVHTRCQLYQDDRCGKPKTFQLKLRSCTRFALLRCISKNNQKKARQRIHLLLSRIIWNIEKHIRARLHLRLRNQLIPFFWLTNCAKKNSFQAFRKVYYWECYHENNSIWNSRKILFREACNFVSWSLVKVSSKLCDRYVHLY